jgi:hypothetical protein
MKALATSVRSLAKISGAGLLICGALSLSACRKDEPPPPLPAAPPAAPPAPAPAPTLEPEPPPSTSASAEPSNKGARPGSSLKRCCDALAQNSKSAPPPNNTLMLQASQVCNAAVAAGSAAPAVLAAVRGALGAAPLPSGCQ